MKLLDRFFDWSLAPLIFPLFLFCLGVFCGASFSKTHYNAVISKMESAYSQEKAQVSESAVLELTKRETRMNKAINDAQAKTTKARADADALGTANRRLQQSLNNYKAKYASVTTISGTSEFDTDPIGMLANLFGRVSTSCERISRYADEVKIAGELCESAWPSPINKKAKNE